MEERSFRIVRHEYNMKSKIDKETQFYLEELEKLKLVSSYNNEDTETTEYHLTKQQVKKIYLMSCRKKNDRISYSES